MQQAQLRSQITIFHTVFLVCLALFILFLIIDIFLFIRLDIMGVIGFLTGKTEKKTVEQMMSGEYGNSAALTGKTKGKKKKKNKKAKDTRPKPKSTIMTPSGQLKMPDSDDVMLPTGSDITDVLAGADQAKTAEQTPVSYTAPPQPPTAPPVPPEPAQPAGQGYGHRFVVEKEIILIHTEERI